MGLNLFKISSSSFEMPKESKTLPNPDPSNWSIVKHKQIGHWLIVKINYHDCINYEGNKILVFKETNIVKLKIQEKIDPHFSESKNFKSPVARFEPTKEGWQNAILFVNAKIYST